MTIIKEFSPTMTFKQAEEWYTNSPCPAEEYLQIIRHFETKIENLEKKIDQLQNECQPKPEFKVRWVYKNALDSEFLVLHIWNDKRKWPLIAFPCDISNQNISCFFTLKGEWLIDQPSHNNLKIETGRPFKTEE